MKISIITPVKNGAATIGRTLDSLASQSYREVEHIVVDGASTDGTAALCAGRCDTLVSEPDNGLYDAINKGIRLAKGDVVGILNADDVYHHQHVLRHVANVMFDPSVDAVFGDLRYVNAAGRRVRKYSSEPVAHARRRMLMGIMPAHPTFFCRRKIYEEHGLYDTTMKVAADFEMMLRLLYKRRITAHYMPECMVDMLIGGISNNSLKAHLHILRDHYRAYLRHRLPLGLLLDPLRYPMKVFDFI